MESLKELSTGEEFLIHAHRALAIFIENGYKPSRFNITGKGDFFLTIENERLQREMSLIEDSSGILDLVIKKKGLFTKPHSFKKESNFNYKGIYHFMDKVKAKVDFMDRALK